MKISKEEIEQAAFNHAIKTNGSDDVDSYRHAGSAVDFIAGADYVYQQLEPIITDMSMDKARRQPDVEQKVKEAVKIALQTAADVAEVSSDYNQRELILSLEQEVLEKLNVK